MSTNPSEMDNAAKDANRSLDAVLEAEARGDESNFKGTDYHIVYALWLLVVQRVEPIYFFAGNDLLASPIPPPRELNDDLSLNSPTAERDEWIQLKCVVKTWTSSALLDENLIVNFIFNSVVSEKNARNWVAKLVTTAPIRRNEIAAFIRSPDDHPALLAKLNKLINKAFEVLDESHPGEFTQQRVRERAFDVLKQLSACEPVALATLRAELNVELALYSHGDVEAMSTLRKRIVGAMVEDSARGSDQNLTYDAQWLERASGISLVRRGTFSVTEVCRRQVHRRAPVPFNNDHVASRKLATSLDEFSRSNATLFILAGRSGTGKTWSLYRWALDSTCALFIPGYRILSHDLCSVVASEVRADLPAGTEYEVFADIVRASQVRGARLNILIDDVMPKYAIARQFAEHLAEVVSFAEMHAVKLVVSSQLDVITSLRPFELVPKQVVFRVDVHSPASNDPSWIQDDLTTDELREATALRIDRGENIAATLTDPAFSVVRNPYILDVVLGQIGPGDEGREPVQIRTLTELIEIQVQKRLELLRRHCNLSITQLRAVLSSLALFLHKNPDSQMMDVSQHLVNTHSLFATEAMAAFVESGILAEWETTVMVTDQRIAARLIADQYLATRPSTMQLVKLLAGSQNTSLAIDILVSLDDPISLADALIQCSNDWIAAVAEGLSLSSADEAKVESFLVALSRSVPHQDEIYSAMGRLALRSDFASRELQSRFIEPQTADSRVALRSLGSIVDINPSAVITYARQKWDLYASAAPAFPNRSKEYREKRNNLADAIAPLKQVQSRLAAQLAQEFLSEIQGTVQEPLHAHDVNLRVTHCFTDPLIAEFAEVRTAVAALLDDEQWNQIVEGLSVTDLIHRISAVFGFADWANRNPEKAIGHMVALLKSESNLGLYATVAWGAVNVARQQARLVLDAIADNLATAWGSYESTCATVALLDVVAESYPAEVLGILPPEISHLPDEAYWLAQELFQFCLMKCAKSLGIAPNSLMSRSGPVEASNELYRLRAIVAETLCAVAIKTQVNSFPLYWRADLRHAGMDFFYVGIGNWFKDEIRSLLAPSIEVNLVDVVIALSNSAGSNPANVLDKWHKNVRFRLEIDSLNVLVGIVENREDRLHLVERLPADWQQLYVLNELLHLGQRGDELINFSLSACEQKRQSATAQASHERNRCLKFLERIVPGRLPPIAKERGFWFLGSSGPERLIASVENEPNMAIATLATALNYPNDILMLTDWQSVTRHWATTMLARVYCRMLMKRVISRDEAKEWCRWMIEVCKDLSSSQYVENQRRVYTAILARLNKHHQPKLPTLASAVGAIADSEQLALRILGLKSAKRNTIRALFTEGRGWWEAHDRKWEVDGEVSGGSGFGESFYVIGFFPAVRLALIAIAEHVDSTDPGYDWMVERSFGELLAKRLQNQLRWGGVDEEIDAAVEMYPEHERLQAIRGHSLILRGEPEQAKAVLRTAISLPLCKGAERASVLYNLACAHAICGESVECKQRLRESSKLQAIDLKLMSKDSDFDGVRDQTWFRRMVRGETWRQEWRSRKERVIAWCSKWWNRLRRSN